MKINANRAALVTNKRLLQVENSLQASMERLSSGLKLNHAKDNPAGMAISNKMKAQIAGLDRASNNASDAIAAIHIADGALNETTSLLQRMRELAVQAANDTNSLEDKGAIQQEIDNLKEEVDRISRDTEYNEMPILDGSLSARVYAENVSRIYTTDTVSAGNYKLTVDEKAEKAEIELSNDINSTNTASPQAEGELSINGYSISIEKEDTYAEIFGKIRDAAEIGGTELKDENGEIKLYSDAYGEDESIRLSFSSKEFATALGFDAANVQEMDDGEVVYGTMNGTELEIPRGTDAKLTLNRTAGESEFSKTATEFVDGNRVTITDKTGFEISFLINDEYQGELNLEVTDVGTMPIHIGANMDQNMVISVPEISVESLYIDDLDVTKMGGANDAMSALDDAIRKVSDARSKMGAYENRLDYSVSSLDAFEENMTGAMSRLTDTDMAQEMTNYTQQNVLSQAAISVLSQANDMPQQVLQLLQ